MKKHFTPGYIRLNHIEFSTRCHGFRRAIYACNRNCARAWFEAPIDLGHQNGNQHSSFFSGKEHQYYRPCCSGRMKTSIKKGYVNVNVWLRGGDPSPHRYITFSWFKGYVTLQVAWSQYPRKPSLGSKDPMSISASFLAESPVRSPENYLFSLSKKKIFWIKVSKKTFYLI